MNDKKNEKKSPKEQDEKFRNALFDAFKSTERGSEAYIDEDGFIVLPRVHLRRRTPTSQDDS